MHLVGPRVPPGLTVTVQRWVMTFSTERLRISLPVSQISSLVGNPLTMLPDKLIMRRIAKISPVRKNKPHCANWDASLSWNSKTLVFASLSWNSKMWTIALIRFADVSKNSKGRTISHRGRRGVDIFRKQKKLLQIILERNFLPSSGAKKKII